MKTTIKTEYYIFLDINDLKPVKKNNILFEFTIPLANRLILDNGLWEMGLSEFCISNNEECPNMYICCDIIRNSYVNNTSLSVLRFIPKTGKSMYKTFPNIYYFEILKPYIEILNMYIYMPEGVLESFEKIPLHCTVHIRKNEDEVH